MATVIVFVVTLSLILMGAATVRASTYTVGGDSGWSPTTDLLGWASGKTFTVGDTLVFNYLTVHSVDTVTDNDYNNCNTGNPLSSYSGGQTTISLDKVGPIFFICPTPGHCQGGMKLSINVVVGSGGSTVPDPGMSPPSIPVRGPDPVIGSPPSVPVVPIRGPDPITDSPPSPTQGGFPPPIRGFPSPEGCFQSSYCNTPFFRCCLPKSPIGGSYGWGQVPYHGAAKGKFDSHLAFGFSLFMAALVVAIARY